MKPEALRVLLVDDSDDDNFFHRRAILKVFPACEVQVCTLATEALDFLRAASKDEDQSTPDLVFIDINLPGMNGWELMEELKSIRSHASDPFEVMVLSTSINPMDRQRATHDGFARTFLNKPLTPEIVRELATAMELPTGAQEQ